MKTWKERIEGDYSDIRGVCHNPKKGQSLAEMEKELGYAQRLNLNAARFWMSQEEWEKAPEEYEERMLQFVRSCADKGIRTMPIFWNGNFIKEYRESSKEEWEKRRQYAKAMIGRLKGEPGILMWDVYNEPLCNDYLRMASEQEYPERKENLVKDLRRLCEIVRMLDDDTPLTVGHEQADHLATTADLVDVISFHDYLPTRRRMEQAYEMTVQIAREQGGKPVLNTETGCIGRANPYDLELELCEKYHCGFFLFNLMIEGFWGEIHGIVYPDGTVRDPGIVAALYGFRRNRGKDRILPRGNREGHACEAVKAVEAALQLKEETLFVNKAKGTDEILEAAEYCINILESCELVPMWDALSARLECFRQQEPSERDEWAIQEFAYNCAKTVKEKFLIL